MTLDEEKVFLDAFHMINTPGWQAFVAEAEETRKSLLDPRQINGAEALAAVKGQLHILDWVLRYEDTMKRVYDHRLAQEAGDA